MFHRVLSALLALPAAIPVTLTMSALGRGKSVPDSMLPVFMFLSAAIFYFVGAAIEWCIGVLFGRR